MKLVLATQIKLGIRGCSIHSLVPRPFFLIELMEKYLFSIRKKAACISTKLLSTQAIVLFQRSQRCVNFVNQAPHTHETHMALKTISSSSSLRTVCRAACRLGATSGPSYSRVVRLGMSNSTLRILSAMNRGSPF